MNFWCHFKSSFAWLHALNKFVTYSIHNIVTAKITTHTVAASCNILGGEYTTGPINQVTKIIYSHKENGHAWRNVQIMEAYLSVRCPDFRSVYHSQFYLNVSQGLCMI